MTSRASPANQQDSPGGEDGIEANTSAYRCSAANETSLAGEALNYVVLQRHPTRSEPACFGNIYVWASILQACIPWTSYSSVKWAVLSCGRGHNVKFDTK
ncbi:hypothetical protein ElyMa_004821700 [Elysia marginata]|uniref:Ig-like domain-containing protein n=1 Tax=Elysia marginata TaxID=1093978 RepID=A0AAV4IKA2_9GAST|nr:hypothetical protein ElyMa_004821700 [Elysia marginata]